MKLTAVRHNDGLWYWQLNGTNGLSLTSSGGFRTRRKALGQFQSLHRRLKKVDRFEADAAAPGEGQDVELQLTAEQRIDEALEVLMSLGQVDGDHHKTWVIDQAARALLGPDYEQTIVEWCSGDDGPDTYAWDEGIAP